MLKKVRIVVLIIAIIVTATIPVLVRAKSLEKEKKTLQMLFSLHTLEEIQREKNI